MIRDRLRLWVAEREEIPDELPHSLVRTSAILPGIKAIAVRHDTTVVFAHVKHGGAFGVVGTRPKYVSEQSYDTPTLCGLTLAVSRARKPQRSGGCRASAAGDCSARTRPEG